jgi:hypothetical protein
MLIEYEVKFDKHGLTIKQRIEPGSPPSVKPDAPLEQNALGASFQDSAAANAARPNQGAGPAGRDVGAGPGGRDKGGGPGGRDKGGGGALGSGPITVIGPIILTCPCQLRAACKAESED